MHHLMSGYGISKWLHDYGWRQDLVQSGRGRQHRLFGTSPQEERAIAFAFRRVALWPNGADLQTNRGAWRPPDPVSEGYGVQSRFRYGIGWIDAHATGLYGQRFCDCTSSAQRDILDHLAYKDRYRSGEDDGRAFFQMVREYTVAGFYTSRIGLEQLGFPGLKAIWMQTPGCLHKDDPEHRRLSLRTT